MDNIKFQFACKNALNSVIFNKIRTHLWQQSLGQQLLRFAGHHQIHQTTVSVLYVRVPERAQAEMSHRPVVQYLCARVAVVYRLLQVRHEDQVARLEPVIVESVVVDVRQDSTRP